MLNLKKSHENIQVIQHIITDMEHCRMIDNFDDIIELIMINISDGKQIIQLEMLFRIICTTLGILIVLIIFLSRDIFP